MEKQAFKDQIAEAYAHLYDLVYLRSQPIVQLLVKEEGLSRKEKAWKVHHILIDAIDELKLQADANPLSRQERRYKLMVLRYVKVMEPQAAADELMISRRHFYREYSIAIAAISDILWHRHLIDAPSPGSPSPAAGEGEASSHLELLRMETARLAQANRYAQIKRVIEDLSPLLDGVLEQRQIRLDIQLPPAFPVTAAINSQLLKQILLSALSCLIEKVAQTHIRLVAYVDGQKIKLHLSVDPQDSVRPTSPDEIKETLSVLEELASVSGATFRPRWAGEAMRGFDIQLPIAQRTVLIVDDNPDILELCRRYLSANHYHVVTTQIPEEALGLARQLQPYAISVDLMMPGLDGWDLLQALLNHPETANVPIIICSVLKQKELALSLGATAFLEKPITEQSLLSVLEALKQD